MKWTIEQLSEKLPLINEGKILLLKRPPWTCYECLERKITTFTFKEDGTFRAVCENCGPVITGELQ